MGNLGDVRDGVTRKTVVVSVSLHDVTVSNWPRRPLRSNMAIIIANNKIDSCYARWAECCDLASHHRSSSYSKA